MAETTPFITGADLKPFCPKIPDATLDAVAKNVDEMFCDLLPLRLKEREIGYMQHEVTMEFNRLYVCTTLLNIQSAKFKNKTLEIKTDGTLKKGLYFKEKEEMSFDPQLYLLITSGYAPDKLPGALKEAMIDYAVEQALTQGQGFSSTVSSYKMGDRTISFRENSAIQDKVLSVVKKYRSGF